ncbi:rhodanese-like domain-containing protein [Alkalicella caledoniensis]|uniref:Rhodanese-like domain-containing protein n=1 Tax=Alkalicella caledoniensis TaxID=2731377 RepID=A0A7G9W834_ALKCA|nr:rhodanese-like domain-containing protein [Alkalicella caledoniensis]QNO14846.1 rhodanese-like domain-containing protein [Alkalicella caledoniensis]
MEDSRLKLRLYFKTVLIMLIPAFLLMFIGYLLLPKTEPYYNNISAEEAKVLIDQYSNQLLIIDVRTPEEYAQGHIPNAVLIPLDELEDRLNEVSNLARNKDYILVVCRSGSRSVTASEIIAKAKHPNVMNLEEGMLGWKYDVETID